MAQPFRFPPPPPPPPPRPSSQYAQSTSSLGRVSNVQHNDFASRGQGGYRANNRGRGGFSGQQYNTGVPGSFNNTNNHQSSAQHGPVGRGNSRGQKRDYTTAFRGRGSNNVACNARLPAATATSSFGVEINSLVTGARPVETTTLTQPATKRISLGLISNAPSADEVLEQDDDQDEEVQLAEQRHVPDGVQFEHRGQTTNLRTPEEIAAWIAERRKKWPTEQTRAVAQKEAEERRERYEAEKAARLQAAKAAATARQEERNKQRLEQEKKKVRQKMLQEQISKAKTASAINVDGSDSGRTAAETKVERLRRKAEKIAAQLRQIETTALTTPQTGASHGENMASHEDTELEQMLAQVDAAAMKQNERIASVGYDEHAEEGLDSSEISSDDDHADYTSSAGSSSDSDSDSDASPEVLSSREHKVDKVPLAVRAPSGTPARDDRPLCRNFVRYGRCKYRRKCHFKHEHPDTTARKRKGLYEAMVDKELEEEHRRALRAIISLGDRGILQDPL